MIWIIGSQVEAQILALEVGLRDYSWRRLAAPSQLFMQRRPNVVVMEHTFDDWHPLRFAALTKALQLLGAAFYTEQDLKEGRVPL